MDISPVAMVGIGASAGGLEALELFFRAVPPDTGMAFVVLQHLSPDFESRMDELLGRQTSLPIMQARDGQRARPDTIYLAPAHSEMILSGGRFVLSEREANKGFSLPIDNFLRSMAHDLGDQAIGVILSGTGRDGSRGAREIREAGGLVLSQAPETAAFDGMPRSVLEAGVVHAVGAPHELPKLLLEHHAKRGELSPTSLAEPPQTSMDRVIDLLRSAHEIDFAHYKPNTVTRRVGRRLAMSEAKNLDDYAVQLQQDPEELHALYRDLMIGVTKFFRDPQAFAILERELASSLDARIADRQFRVWVPGCATGEEAYSLAILLHEAAQAVEQPPEIKIFATDAHGRSLDIASTGRYPEESLTEVTPKRRERYFVLDPQGGYRVVGELRQMVVFARHNVISNAPFTRIDLVSCRNLLIYFEPPAQKKVLALFHFALRTGGILFLGPSEAPGPLSDEFQTASSHWKIFRKRRDIRLPIETRLPLAPVRNLGLPGLANVGTRDQRLLPAYDQLLDIFMPAGVLVDDRFELMHTFGEIDELVRLPRGRASSRLFDLLDPNIRTAVAGALHRAVSSKQSVRFNGLVVVRDGEVSRHCLTVQPLVNKRLQTTDYFLGFERLVDPTAADSATGEVGHDSLSRDYVGSLETELRFAQENLQSTVEELETSNEELQAANEELVASNEELQSTNEELHSVNEELYTVNAEHQKQIDELRELTDDLDNLLQSIDVGVIFLDRDLRIRKFTRSIVRSFRLMPQDVGRRLHDFAHDIHHPDLLTDLHAVLSHGDAIEREVVNGVGDMLLMRLLPYRTGDAITGVVLSLIDINTLKRSEANVKHLSAIVESSGDAIVTRGLDGTISSWNRAAEQLFGYSEAEVIGQDDALFVPEGQRAQLRALFEQAVQGEPGSIETVRRRKDGELLDVSVSVSPMRDSDGRVFALSAIVRDISRRKRAEHIVQRSIEQRDHFLAMLSHELRNPLMGIMAAAEVLHQPSSGDSLKRQASTVVLRQSQQMARLLDDLLDVTRLQRGSIEMRKERFDLRGAVLGALDAVEPRARATEVQLDTNIAPDEIVAHVDPARIQQLLVNLLANAIKYTPAGKSVVLTVTRCNEDAIIRVSDQGVGIRSEILDDIFEPFQRGDEPLHRDDAGMGLGLTLVKSIARAHGGDVSVHSPGPGLGSVFTVTIPVLADSQVEGVATTPRVDSDIRKHRRILLVEDSDDNRELLAMALAARGFEVLTADCGRRALDILRKHTVGVAIVDIGLPDMTGLDVARQVREMHTVGENRPLRLIALTGHGRSSDRDAVREAGFDDHLVKPVTLAHLEAAVAGLGASR
jgi:two-component system CheB/CheR fusion protein